MFIHFVSSTIYQALVFTSDFKLGHYMKIPPLPMFWALGCLVHKTKTLRKLMCERVVTLGSHRVLVALCGRKAIRETGWFADVGLTV